MPGTTSIDPHATALLVMDFQVAIIEGVDGDQTPLLDRAARLVDAARKAGVMVIYVVVGFRNGHPEVGQRNPLASRSKQGGRFVAAHVGAAIHPVLTPRPDDIIVTKHRAGAFAGTDLTMILRANDITTLVVTGVATGGCVVSTVRQAADDDYSIIVVSDCCADREADVHRVLVEKLFPRQATVLTADQFVAAL
jgi:nicotinamidase-related amidase